MSYQQLDRIALSVAELLGGLAARRDRAVALWMPKSPLSIAAIHGAWRHGSPYMPVSPGTSPDRAAGLRSEDLIGAAIVASESDAESAGKALGPTVPILLVHPNGASILAGSRAVDADISYGQKSESRLADFERPAVLLYTSGSTGRPKTVEITHGNLAAFAEWAHHYFDIRSSDVLLSHAPLEFDLSFFDLFAGLTVGASVALLSPRDTLQPDRVAQIVSSHKVTVWQSVPTALTLQLAHFERSGAALPSVRAVLFAGESIPRRTLLGLPRLFPNAELFNVYGCTETNDSFVYRVPSTPERAPDPLPIGSPLPHVSFQVADAEGREVRRGETGELLVGGPTVMRRYAGRDLENRTAQVNRALAETGLYPTRDLVSQGSDGLFRFHGRLDQIVKIRGYQVNLAEVESVLQSHPEVVESAAIVAADPRGVGLLVAVCRLQGDRIDSLAQVWAHCREALPPTAVPHELHCRPSPFPRSRTDKVDRRALLEWWASEIAEKLERRKRSAERVDQLHS